MLLELIYLKKVPYFTKRLKDGFLIPLKQSRTYAFLCSYSVSIVINKYHVD